MSKDGCIGIIQSSHNHIRGTIFLPTKTIFRCFNVSKGFTYHYILDLKIISTLHPLFFLGEGSTTGASPMHCGKIYLPTFRRPPLRRSLCLGCPSWWRVGWCQGFVWCPFFGFQNSWCFWRYLLGDPPKTYKKTHQISGGMTGSLEIDAKLWSECISEPFGLKLGDWEGGGGIVWRGNLWIQHKLIMGNAVPFEVVLWNVPVHWRHITMNFFRFQKYRLPKCTELSSHTLVHPYFWDLLGNKIPVWHICFGWVAQSPPPPPPPPQ